MKKTILTVILETHRPTCKYLIKESKKIKFEEDFLKKM